MENKNYSTKAIVEAALISVIISIIMILTGYLPMVSFIGTLILPIPVAILYIRYNRKVTVSGIFLSIILTSIVFNPIRAIYAAIPCIIIGIVLGYCVKRSKSSSTTLLFLIIACSISNILTIVYSLSFIAKINFMDFISRIVGLMKQSMKSSIDAAKDVYSQNGITPTPEQLKFLDKNYQMISKLDVALFLAIIPVGIFIVSLVTAYLNCIVARAILSKLNYKMEKVLPFRNFCVSNIVGAVLIGMVCIGIILASKKITGGNLLRDSSQLLMQTVFSINGLAASTYFLRVKRKLSKPMVILILGITMISPLVSIYFSIGIMEMALDFRKLDPYRIRRK